MSYPKTKEQWWNLCEKNKVELRNLVRDYTDMPPTLVDQYTAEEDNTIVALLQAAWGGAPDVPEIHNLPGWNALCDLCSESYLAFKE